MVVDFPRTGDTVFDGDPVGGRATLMSTGRIGPGELSLMAGGYRESADMLVERLSTNGRNDALVYPLLFGYRQYLELRLKALCLLIAQGDQTDDDFPWTHDLERLWNLVRNRLHAEVEDTDREAFEATGSVVLEFHRLDPRSDRFRYPSDIEQRNLRPRELQAVMGRTSNFLDSLTDWWQAGIDARG